MESEWSQWIFSGADSERLTTCITMGRRDPEATHSTSHMRAIPAPELAVWTRPPAAAAPMQALIEACSLSTGMNSVSTFPLATKSLKRITISVWGVMG
jgi:hypothetical protein